MFYEDSNYAYIISADYLLWSKVPETAKEAGLQQSAADDYSASNMYWADLSKVTSRLSQISDEVKEKFHFKLYNTNTDQPNTYATANLLDTNNWKAFALESIGAEAIGSPTLELWVDSWNLAYPKDTLNLEISETTGYLIGNSSTPASNIVDMKDTEGYNNTLYCPHHIYTDIPNGIGVSNGYWLASPSAMVSDRLCRVGYDGGIGGGGFSHVSYDGYCSLRPVVCIPKSTNKITRNEDQIWIIN